MDWGVLLVKLLIDSIEGTCRRLAQYSDRELRCVLPVGIPPSSGGRMGHIADMPPHDYRDIKRIYFLSFSTSYTKVPIFYTRINLRFRIMYTVYRIGENPRRD